MLNRLFKENTQQIDDFKTTVDSSLSRHRLWEIKKENKSSYLLGSQHACSPLSFNKTLLVMLIKKIDAFYAEIDLDQFDLSSTAKELKSIRDPAQDESPASTSLTKKQYDDALFYLTKNTYPKAYRINSSNEVHSLSLRKFTFLLATTAISRSQIKKYEDTEQYLWRLSKQEGKKVEGLETNESRLNSLLSNYSNSEVIKEINQLIIISQFVEFVPLINGMTHLVYGNDLDYEKYYNEKLDTLDDIKKIEAITSETEWLIPFRKNIVNTRNEYLFQQMHHKMQTESGLFAVGLGHLYGETGLLKLLQNAGYECTPLKNKNQYTPLHTFARGFIMPTLIASLACTPLARMTRNGIKSIKTNNFKFSFKSLTKFNMASVSAGAGVYIMNGAVERLKLIANPFSFFNNKDDIQTQSNHEKSLCKPKS